MRMHFTLLLLTVMDFASCAKILAVFPSPGYSQFILGEQLMLELIRRGHEVTVISPYKPKEEIQNYRPILVDDILKIFSVDLYDLQNLNLFETIILFERYGKLFTECILAHREVQQLIHSNETFHVVIVEQMMNEAVQGLAAHFNVPLISFNSMGITEWISHITGIVRLPSVSPSLYVPYTDGMSFLERLHNSLVLWWYKIYNELISFPKQQELLTKYFPGKMDLKEIMNNVSIIIVNSHASTVYPSILTPSVIEIGGFHVSSKNLPNNIQEYLDEATEGAILFSMGSNIRSADISRETLQGILKAFSKLRQKILWKFEDNNLPNKPSNVLVSKWLPQSDILAHPNVVAFITHGGLLSTTEAIYFGVPMIGIPIFCDQGMNVALSVKKQIAVHLPFKELSETSLSAALNEVLRNPMYSRKAKEFSGLLKDQITKPMDLAMFWIEYVIRHGGAPHLKTALIELYWYEIYLLDVMFFIITCVILFYYFAKLFLKIIFRKFAKLYLDKKQKMS